MSGIIGGRYRIIRHLGAGGFGQTFLAEDIHLPGNPLCVVKLLQPAFGQGSHRVPLLKNSHTFQLAQRLFHTEAQVLYKLGEHNQIPRLLAHFEEDQEFYLVEEYVEGDELSKELKHRQQWNEAQVIDLLLHILTPLAFVHQHKVIHRDLKPANLMRRKQDGKIVLIDFGAVKEIMSQVSGGQSQLTIGIGTAGYMPNEQSNGKPNLSSDVYAVGMIGIEALTGLHPTLLNDPNTGEIAWRNHVQVSPKLAEILDKMVRPDYRHRYKSATEVLQIVANLKKKPKTIINPKLIGISVTLLLAVVIGVVILTRSIDLRLPKDEPQKKEIPAF